MLCKAPILFSLYFDKIIDVVPNWSPFVSFCHLLSALQMCTPQSVHADFNQYGPGLDGNVYNIYFFQSIKILELLGLWFS